MEPLPDTPKQASYKEKAAIKWNVNDLLAWIKDKRPDLLDDEDSEKLRKAEMSGEAFLAWAGDRVFFKNGCDLRPGPAAVLADLSRKLAEEEKKSKFYLSCHAHHVDSKLTTSQETDSRPKMWTCPTPPI